MGSGPGLRALFGGMARRFRPSRANGFEGDIEYVLSGADGELKPWVVTIAGNRASARPGRSAEPAVTISMSVADFARVAARDLDPGKALVNGRLQLDGDFAIATRLGEMFGEPSPY